MPQAKTTRGQLKNFSCPGCGKKFCTATNVLQHMNQPAGSCCASVPLFNEATHLVKAPADSNSYYSFHHLDQSLPSEIGSPRLHQDIEVGDEVSLDDYTLGDSWIGDDAGRFHAYQDMEVDGEGAADFDDHGGGDSPQSDPTQTPQGRFVEMFDGCAETFPGGKTFMDDFWADQYAQQRQENIYYPWASKQEWAFASWLLQSRLSMAAIDNLLSLDIIKNISLSFRSAKDLRARAEILPHGPKWRCETLTPEYPVKQPLRLFYRNPIECLQSLLSHPLFEPHISFIPQKVWTCATKICRVYDEWLTGDRAWNLQEALPPGATLLGVVLSSDKTNISVMSGNRLAYPLLISLANIDARIRSKSSLHAYLLLALLPIPRFTHKSTRICGLLRDRLVHQALNIVLSPLKIAAAVGIMMSDPAGNLRYCFTPLASWIADTPEESLVAATGSKVSPVTTAVSKNFGNSHRHPPRTVETTVAAIHMACSKHSPKDYKNFLKIIQSLGLNGVVEPVWMDWALSQPCDFITIEPLHHFHRFAWDHDVKWCVTVLGAAELDFRFSIIQTLVGYRAFDEGISNLKQVTGHDHRSVQRYIIGVIAGGVPRRFLIALRSLLDFRYLAQAPTFTTDSLERVSWSLQEFHDNKDAVVHHGARQNWELPKLELLQSVVPGIRQSGAAMQWSADVTEHAHVEEIKVPARASNNQNYYSQISRHLDRLDKCFRFDLATHIEDSHHAECTQEEGFAEEDHEPDSEKVSIGEYFNPIRPITDYFTISSARSCPSGLKPPHTFATSTMAFHLATKPSLRLTLSEAAIKYELPDLGPAVSAFISQQTGNAPPGPDNPKLQIWHSLCVQQRSYHQKDLEPPQTLRAIPPSATNPYGLYDSAIVSPGPDSHWPDRGLEDHSVVQLRLIFHPLQCNFFAAYVQCFNVASRGNSGGISPVTGMHCLKRVVRANGERIGEVIPLTFIWSPAHLIPQFGAEANPHLTRLSSCELSTEFWLNKYWSKEFYYALSPI